MTRDQSQLRELTAEIVDVQRPLWSLGNQTGALYDFLQERADFNIDADRDISEGETRSESGLAISPTQAAMCGWEVARTAGFVRGIARAIEDLVARFPDRPIQVLYAGCGPNALLAMPLMTLFSAEQIQFVFLDIHQRSIASARSVVESLDFSHYVTDYVHGDACNYDSGTGARPDLIVSETMNVCLSNEPLVMIACHLLSQNSDAILIPLRVRVDACLVAEGQEFKSVAPDHEGDLPVPDRDRVFLATVFELTEENARRWGPSPGDCLPATRVTIPTPLEPRYRPMLLTTVNVYGDVVLRDYDCSLTIPTPIKAGQPLEGGEVVEFEYRLGKHPGLDGRVVEPG